MSTDLSFGETDTEEIAKMFHVLIQFYEEQEVLVSAENIGGHIGELLAKNTAFDSLLMSDQYGNLVTDEIVVFYVGPNKRDHV